MASGHVFYESFCNSILLVVTLLIGKKRPKDGILLSVYFIGYGVIRAIVEGFRTDSLYLTGSIRVSQLLSALLVLTGILLLVLIKKGVIQTRDYSGKYCIAPADDEAAA
jgi:phosphatidylglycerol:prolipoprotein diacylglycerol transferase